MRSFQERLWAGWSSSKCQAPRRYAPEKKAISVIISTKFQAGTPIMMKFQVLIIFENLIKVSILNIKNVTFSFSKIFFYNIIHALKPRSHDLDESPCLSESEACHAQTIYLNLTVDGVEVCNYIYVSVFSLSLVSVVL